MILAEEILVRAGEGLRLARQAADYPCRRMPLDPHDRGLLSLELPHLAEGRSVARFLALSARVEAARGRTDKALDDVLRIARIGRDYKEEPILISVLVGLAIDGIACATANQILAAGAPASPAALSTLREALRIEPDLYRKSLIHERVFGLDCFEHLSRSGLDYLEQGGMDASLPAWPVLAWMIRPWIRFEEIGYLDLMNDSIRMAPDACPDFEKLPRYYVMNHLLLPAIERSHQSHTRSRARSDVTRWGLAVLEERARTGRLPETLGDLLADHPQDPIAKNPFVYKPDSDGKGFLLYGVGPDGKDDGGSVVTTHNQDPTDFGIHWRVP